MADGLTALALSLLGDDTQQAIRAENPYYRLQAVPSEIGQAATQLAGQQGRKGLGESLAWGVGSGLLSGLLGGAGDQYQQTLTDRYLKAAQTPGATAESSELPPGLFGKASRTGEMFRMQNALDQRASAQKFQQDRAAKMADLLAERGYSMTPEGKLEQFFDPVKLDADKARKTEAAKKQGELDAYAGTEPGSGADLLNPITGKKTELEEKARSELKTAPLAADLQDIKANFETLVDSYQYNDKAATLAMVSSFARILDPGGTVKEGEVKNVENTQSFLASFGLTIEGLFSGKQSIGAEAKQAMIRAAGAKYNKFGANYLSLLDTQKNLVKRKGGNPENVFGPVEYTPFDFTQWASKLPEQKTIQEQMLSQSGENDWKTVRSLKQKVAGGGKLTTAEIATLETLLTKVTGGAQGGRQ